VSPSPDAAAPTRHAAGPGAGRWYTPRDASQAPWLGPAGWRDIASAQLGLRQRRVLAQARNLQQRIAAQPIAPATLGARMAAQRRAMRRAALNGAALPSDIVMEGVHILAALAQQAMGMTPSLPQLVSTIAMATGHLVQLAPGEGKTLAVAMTGIWYAWSGKPCHVVTSNDYLAGRDAELMRPLYTAGGVSVGGITGTTPSEDLPGIYRNDVVYATANQLLADFLRDDLLLNKARDPVRRRLWQLRGGAERAPVMRGLHAAIIDEADGVLIDEATTPLIIAEPEDDRSQMLPAIARARELVEQLERDVHYELFLQGGGVVHFLPAGHARMAELAPAFSSYWRTPARTEELFRLAIMAREVFQRDRHYIVLDGEVVIVDEGTGRSMPGRTWSHGVHQSIEAREGLKLSPPTRISARMTFQEFFRHYHRLCGASGTLHGLGFELWKTFGTPMLRVAPKAASRLRVMPRRHFATRADKLVGIVARIAELQQQGAPVLVGTRRISDSEEIAAALQARGVACTVLNAKEHEREAEIVAQAGGFGCVTVATNMAGRGTDIMLAAGVEEAGGLQVLMFESHESPRIDWQLFGRAGRHGAQGSAQAFASFEEELVERYLPAWAQPLRWLPRLPGTSGRQLALLLWLAQRHAQGISAGQRKRLAQVQEQLREHLGFTRA
jgi:preprotein translocase subunit SecA